MAVEMLVFWNKNFAQKEYWLFWYILKRGLNFKLFLVIVSVYLAAGPGVSRAGTRNTTNLQPNIPPRAWNTCQVSHLKRCTGFSWRKTWTHVAFLLPWKCQLVKRINVFYIVLIKQELNLFLFVSVCLCLFVFFCWLLPWFLRFLIYLFHFSIYIFIFYNSFSYLLWSLFLSVLSSLFVFVYLVLLYLSLHYFCLLFRYIFLYSLLFISFCSSAHPRMFVP